MKRVTFFYGSFRPGGVERIRALLISEFANNGFIVDVVVVNGTGEFRPADSEKVKIFDLQSRSASQCFPKYLQYLRIHRPDVIISSQTHHNLIAIIGKIITGFPKRLYITEHIHLSASSMNQANWKQKMRPFIAKVFYHFATGVIAVSQQIKDDLVSVGVPSQMITVLNNPIDLEAVRNSAIEPVITPFPDQAMYPTIISVGRLVKQKNFSDLILCVAKVKTQIAIRAIIIGDGPEKQSLQNLIDTLGLSDEVKLVGYLKNPFPYISNSQLFVLSSKWEGFPNVLVESLACGCPIVSTDCMSGPAEILADGKFGRLVPVGDIDSMSSTIIAELENPHPRQLLLERAQEYSVNKIYPQYLDLIYTNLRTR
jgi:glycosyltransferase involved in cell wall biosynthesis